MSNELKRKLSQKEADALELETKLKEALKHALEQEVGLGLMLRTAVLTFLYALFPPLQTDARREEALNSSLRQQLERAKTKVEDASQLVRFAFCLPAASR